LVNGRASGLMAARWRRVVVTFAGLSLLAFYLVFHHHLSFDICSNSTHNTLRLRDDVLLHARSAVSSSSNNRSQLRHISDVRPTSSSSSSSLPTTTTTTSRDVQRDRARLKTVIHRCPRSFNITDPEDAWFRTAVVQRSPATSQVAFTDEILVLTPICNSEQHLKRYFENLCSLAYPHRLLSVVLGEDSSDDNTVEVMWVTGHLDPRRFGTSADVCVCVLQS